MPGSLWTEVLTYVVLPLLVILGGSAWFVHLLTRRRLKLEPLADGTFTEELEQASLMDEWAREIGFTLVGYFTVGRVGNTNSFLAVWRLGDIPTYFGITYVTAGTGQATVVTWSVEFSTHFTHGVMLDTGNLRDAHLCPKPPGYYTQTFAGLEVDELWERHQEAIRYLTYESHLALSLSSTDLQTHFEESVNCQMSYVRSLPFWYLRGPWWYLGRRYLLHDQSLEQQHRKRRIRLPHEIR